MKVWTEHLPYFTYDELKCKASGEMILDMRFAAALPALRLAWGESMTLNSCCRSPEHNAKEGGHPRSLHLTRLNPRTEAWGTMAADVAWRHWDAIKKLKFARMAFRMGWAVGLHDGFCHVDRRLDIGLAQTVFIYDAWSHQFPATEITKC